MTLTQVPGRLGLFQIDTLVVELVQEEEAKTLTQVLGRPVVKLLLKIYYVQLLVTYTSSRNEN